MKDLEDSSHSDQERSLAIDQNRVVVFGSRMTKAGDLSAELQSFLESKGVPSPNVLWFTDIAYIEDAFFGAGDDNKSLPRGVIIFPEMRRYFQGDGGAGESIPTNWGYGRGRSIREQIESLCDLHNVPHVYVEFLEPQTVLRGLERLLLSAPDEN